MRTLPNTVIKFALGLVAALAALLVLLWILIVTLDWNRARPYINERVSAATGREFVIAGDLRVALGFGPASETGWRHYVPRPHIVAHDVSMSNPDRSSVGPALARVKAIDISLHLLPLLARQVNISDLGLQEAAVALERRPDRSNNWTFKSNGPSRWQFKVQQLRVAGANIRYLDPAIKLDVSARIDSLAAPQLVAGSIQPYGLAFTLGGSYNGAAVSGGGKGGQLLTLAEKGVVYPVQVKGRIGDNAVSLDGRITQPSAVTDVNLRLSLSGRSMADLYPLTRVVLPDTPAYATSGHLIGKIDENGSRWVYDKFTGTVGSSDLSGTVEYLVRQPRPLLRGKLQSTMLKLADLGPAIGADSNQEKRNKGKPAVQPDSKALPVEQFNTARWGAMDADISFSGKQIVRTHDIPLKDVAAELHLKDKVVTLTPLNFGAAGGNVTSNVMLDGRTAKIDAQIRMAARHMQIRQLFPKLESMQASFGEVNADAFLRGGGNSIAAMLASANGELNGVVTDGSVSKFILEAAGLNVANAVFVKVFGDKQVHLNCMVSSFVVKDGQAQVRRFVLDTDDAVVDVSGHIDLARELLDLDVRPKSKGVRIFSLRTPLYAKGSFKHSDVGPYKGPLALKAGAAVALAALAPVAAVLPLVNIGKVEDTNCAPLLAQAEQPPTMQPPAARR
ncbi:AsmA family protein [Herbaspirillum autotrophicum]|uniref:AsmA family protein n=1 Tax=Herbaspirillum autotrophicum TaxID=180195 RepID=UPI00067AB172|nr:AsmA family protein [Herbaspirillum autotrophicum]